MATRCFSNLISDSKKVSEDDISSLCDFTAACLEKTSPDPGLAPCTTATL